MTLPALPLIEAFCRTYEAGSFTRAARVMSLTPQAVSRAVASLEAQLGITLFRRSTRSLAVTDAGRRYYEHAAQALALLGAGAAALEETRATPEGLVRISAGTVYGLYRLAPRMGEFRRLHPKVQVELHLSSRNIDFVADGFDLAIRLGAIADAALVARKLGEFPLGVFASPSYLAHRGRPERPEDLARHDCITFLLPRTGRSMPWEFSGATRRIEPLARYRVADDVLGTVALARAGVGLIQTYDFLVGDAVARGELVEVLQAFRILRRSFSLVYPRANARTPAVRALIDFIVQQAKSDAGL